MFIGREEELKEIRDSLKSTKFESIMIYGRRRVGKTEIINEAIKDYNGAVIHYECKRTSSLLNLEYLGESFCHTLNIGNLKFNSFDDFFDYAFKLSIDKEYVLVIDEFSFLLDDDFSIESSLAVAIDKYKNKSKLKLIISGSYVTIMKKMIEYGSHSYGRFNHIMLICPFDYYTSSLFYENYSPEDKIKMYSIFGGLPYFNSLINSSISANENIINLIIKKDSIIEHELNEMILSETQKISYLNDLIAILGRGTSKYSDIVGKLNQYKDARPDYLLNKLIEMNIIKKVVPINEKHNNKKVFYTFEDNLMHFYYKYVFNSPFSLNRANPKFFFDNFIKEDLETQYIPKKFENIALEFLLRMNLMGKISPIIYELGTYTFNDSKNKINRQFDVVTLDKSGYIQYECKYTNALVGIKEIREEETQVQQLNIKFYKLGFISKNGFDTNLDLSKYNCFVLKDFYNF